MLCILLLPSDCDQGQSKHKAMVLKQLVIADHAFKISGIENFRLTSVSQIQTLTAI